MLSLLGAMGFFNCIRVGSEQMLSTSRIVGFLEF